MDTVPLDLQRRCEQRWAARYQRPLEPAATPEHRLQKQDLFRRLDDKSLSMAVFFIYTGKDLPDYGTVYQKIGVILQKLIKEI